jgi:hypothetical protein
MMVQKEEAHQTQFSAGGAVSVEVFFSDYLSSAQAATKTDHRRHLAGGASPHKHNYCLLAFKLKNKQADHQPS